MKDNIQAEKLAKLIGLAWGNGWQRETPEGLWPEYKTIKMFTGAPIRIDIEFPPGIRQSVTGLDAQNVIIFDHDFIKALCKGSIKEKWDYDAPQGELYKPWEHHITHLAISTNRIDYLYGEFCE